MRVQATDYFKVKGVTPLELNFIPDVGFQFDVTKERYEVLRGNNQYGVCFVTKVEPKKIKKGKAQNKIAVIIPNHNYAEWLPKCINSILNQTYKNFEIIFVDDVSTDNSVDVAKRLLKKPHKVIELKQQRYTGGARNEGYLAMSKDVDYVFCIDSDDWLLTDTAFEEINELLKNAPDVVFMGVTYHSNGTDTEMQKPLYKTKYDALKGWSGNGKVVRKELATRQECLYSEGTLKEDKNQHCKICIYMQDFLCIDKPFYVWNRDNRKSVTTVREKIKWGTSTIRHLADTKELYLTVKGQDAIVDKYMEERLEQIEKEIKAGGDRQF